MRNKEERDLISEIQQYIRNLVYAELVPVSRSDELRGYDIQYKITVPFANIEVVRNIEILTANTIVVWDNASHSIIKTIPLDNKKYLAVDLQQLIPSKIKNTAFPMLNCIYSDRKTTRLQRLIFQAIIRKFNVNLEDIEIQQTHFTVDFREDTMRMEHVILLSGKTKTTFTMVVNLNEDTLR